jgi:hypothetical protein
LEPARRKKKNLLAPLPSLVVLASSVRLGVGCCCCWCVIWYSTAVMAALLLFWSVAAEDHARCCIDHRTTERGMLHIYSATVPSPCLSQVPTPADDVHTTIAYLNASNKSYHDLSAAVSCCICLVWLHKISLTIQIGYIKIKLLP